MATTNLLTTSSSAVAIAEDEEAEQPSFEVILHPGKKTEYKNPKHEPLDVKRNDQCTNVNITIDKTVVKAHFKVLSQFCKTLKTMTFPETKDGNVRSIVTKNSSVTGINSILDYLYDGHVIMEDKLVPDILASGHEFSLQWIIDICKDYLIKYLACRDYALAVRLAEKYSLSDIRETTIQYFGENLRSLIERGDFYKETCFDVVYNFLESGFFVDVSEFLLLQIVLKWVGTNKSIRTEKLLTLLRNIRFPLMTIEELNGISKPVTDYPDINSEIQAAIKYQTNIPAQCLQTGAKYLSRGARPTVILSTFGGEDSVVIYKEPIDNEDGLFVERLGPAGVFEDYSTTTQTVLGNFLYAAGGFKEELQSSSSMYRYDPRDRKWIPIINMSQSRSSFSMCSSKDRLYVVGGVYHDINDGGEEIILKSVESYYPGENGWNTMPDLPYGMFDTASAICDGILYVSGGISEHSVVLAPQKNMFSFESKHDKWTASPDMIHPRQGHSMSAIGKHIYVLGGYTAQEQNPRLRNCHACEVFNTVTEQWSEIASTPAKFGHLFRHVGVLENKIYFLCTEDSEVFSACYDSDGKRFSEFVKVELGVCKVSVLSVGYPHPW